VLKGGREGEDCLIFHMEEKERPGVYLSSGEEGEKSYTRKKKKKSFHISFLMEGKGKKGGRG